MKCPSCGAEQFPGTKFCASCGTPLEQQSQTYSQNQQNPYGQQNSGQFGYSPYNNEHNSNQFQIAAAEKKAKTALICGLIGFICAGFILGIVALVQGFMANKEMKALGLPASSSATAGIVLGIIDLIGWVIVMVYMPSLF